MAVFDALVNNADRKGGHVLAMTDGHRYGVDHGVTFHVENKLRTVLWGWSGEPLTTAEREAVEAVRDAAPAISATGSPSCHAAGGGGAGRSLRTAAPTRTPARPGGALAGHPVAALLSTDRRP